MQGKGNAFLTEVNCHRSNAEDYEFQTGSHRHRVLKKLETINIRRQNESVTNYTRREPSIDF